MVVNSNTETEQKTPKIEEPNLDNLDPWLEKYITKPNVGIEERGGGRLSEEEALNLTRQQLRDLVTGRSWKRRYTNGSRAERGLKPLSRKQYDLQIKRQLIEQAKLSSY